MVPSDSGSQAGIAFLTFADPEHARMCVHYLNRFRFKNKTIRARFARVESTPQPGVVTTRCVERARQH